MLTSLVIQDPGNRVKKRRDVSGKPRGIFRLAETVPPTWEGKGDEAEALKTRIKGLMDSAPTHPTPTEGESGPSGSSDKNKYTTGKRERETSGRSTASGGPSNPKKRPSPDRSIPSTATQYKVIPPISPRSRMMLPPKVYSHKELVNIVAPVQASSCDGQMLIR